MMIFSFFIGCVLYKAALQDDDCAILHFMSANTPLCFLYQIIPISEQLIKETFLPHTTTNQESLPAILNALKLCDALSQATD
jgi:hypothetical protein